MRQWANIVPGVALFLCGMPQVAFATNSVVVTPEFIGALSEEMRTNHPGLLAASERRNAAAFGVETVRTWDDPMARMGGMAAERMMRMEDGDLFYGVEQKLPLFGKPAASRRVAKAELVVEGAAFDYQFQRLRADLAKIAFRVALAEQVVAIGEQDLAWLGTMAETIDSKYQANEATLGEVLQIQNEQARRTTQLQTERDALSHLRLTLNRMLNRDLRSPWPALELPAIAGPVHYNERLVTFAAKFEPKLQMMREQVKQAQAMVDSTRRERFPEVSVGAESRNYTGNGEWRQAEFMVSFSLPFFNAKKYRANISRDEARAKASEFDATDYELSLREEVHDLTIKIDAARREALTYRDEIIPRSESALESARASWVSTRGMFRDVLEARRMLLEARLMYVRAVSEQYQMMSELVLCCGLGDLAALEMIGAVPNTKDGGSEP